MMPRSPDNDMNGCAVFILVLIIGIAGLAFSAWILMLLLGALACMTGWSTAIGYTTSLVIVGIIAVVGSVFRR